MVTKTAMAVAAVAKVIAEETAEATVEATMLANYDGDKSTRSLLFIHIRSFDINL